MPIIKPISDLRNYPDVLRNVEVGTPVYLTKNGTGRYVLMDIDDFSRSVRCRLPKTNIAFHRLEVMLSSSVRKARLCLSIASFAIVAITPPCWASRKVEEDK